MKVLITGARGFVGQHLIRDIQKEWPGTKIISWDLPEVDITKPETYREELATLQPDWVAHLAALPAVGASAKLRERYLAVNAVGTRRLLATMAAVSPQTRTLAVSSAEVYGLAATIHSGQPVGELSLEECRPANPYGESKLAMERIISERFADQTILVRPFPHFGPGQKTGFVTSDFAAQIAAAERSGAGTHTIHVGNLASKRDFTDVRDVVRAYRLLMERELVGEVFNVASGQARSIQEVLDKLLLLSSAHIRLEEDPARLRSVDIPVVGDAARLQAATGWKPEIVFEQSLRDILEWWRGQKLLR